MPNILNTIAEQSASFIPTSPTQYLALQIARRLSDETALRHYLVLFEHHPEDLLVRVYHRCATEQKLTGPEFMRTFRELTIEQQ
jgi:hypothetical protein